MIRHLLPVRSPLDLAAIWGGVRAMASRGALAAAEAAVIEGLGQVHADADVLFVDSGTSALGLAIGGTGTTARRPVAIPAFACYDIATAVDAADAPFVLYDIDPLTLQPDPVSLRHAFERGADRVVIVHLYGVPVDLGPIEVLARRFGATIVEDAAQAVGATTNGKALGTRSPLAVLSFGRGKGVTGGRGGALLGRGASGRALLERARASLAPATGSTRELIALVAQLMLARPWLYAVPASIPFLRLGETVHHPPHAPTRMSALAHGVLARSIRTMSVETERRRSNAAQLLERLTGTGFSPITIAAGSEAGYLRLPVLAPSVVSSSLGHGPARRLGVMRSYPTTLAELPGFGARRLNAADEFPGARRLASELITLPVHGALSRTDLAALLSWIDAVGQGTQPGSVS